MKFDEKLLLGVIAFASIVLICISSIAIYRSQSTVEISKPYDYPMEMVIQEGQIYRSGK